MKQERILLTGGAGYVGSTLVGRLLEAGHKVRVLDRLQFGGESLLGALGHPNFELRPGDIRDVRAIGDALAGVDAVVHLAALVGDPACARDPEETRSINYDATRRLVDSCVEAGIPRLIFASTCSNYGISDTSAPVSEDAPLNPVSLYAETKVAAEEYVLAAERTVPAITILRLATVFGLSPRMRFDLLLNEFVRDAACEGHVRVYGPLSWRPLLHVRDAASAFFACLSAEPELVAGEVFNIGSVNCQKIDLVTAVQLVLPGVGAETLEGKKDPRDYRVSFEKFQSRFGHRPQFTLERGVREVAGAIQTRAIRDPYAASYRNVD